MVALPLLVTAPPPPPPPIVLPLLPPPEQPERPPSCKRMDAEIAKCDAGMRSCNQHRIDYWHRRRPGA
jgi:hypothetical protein